MKYYIFQRKKFTSKLDRRSWIRIRVFKIFFGKREFNCIIT